jgi:hypothetical protein
MIMELRDALLKQSRALPASASATVNGAAIDLGHGSKGRLLADVELLLTAPAVNTTMAPDTRTFTYSIITSDAADLSNPVVLMPSVIVQTGADGAGAPTADYRFRLPTNTKRYVGVRVVSGASTADASAVSATLEVLA